MLALVEEKKIDSADQKIQRLKDDIREYLRGQNNGEELLKLEYAFEDISTHHGNQIRKSGEPTLIHPLRVAWSICEVGLDPPTVIVALLHDLIEDTEITKEQIRTRYGDWYAYMVDGLTKITSPKATKGQSQLNLEATYHKMLSTMVKDVRILFIKMFDRLDNMRDMAPMPRHKQRRISHETYNVYVPLAKRLGLEKICQEYTELCFKYLYPNRYEKTVEKLQDLKKERQSAVQEMCGLLQGTLRDSNLSHTDVDPIFVHPEAYIQKLEVDKILEGFRILVENSPATYQVLGALHTSFRAVPLKIRDFISNPRWDGYKGLQTEIIVDGEVTFIEIVSREMHALNWHGIMAYWKGTPSELAEYYRIYLEQIDDIVGEKEPRMEEVLRYSQAEQIQVFTPRGEVRFFPKGATVLDFAYHIHTDLGNTCIGALVNAPRGRATHAKDKRVSRERELFDGESVRILTNSSIKPHRNWLKHIVTAKSKNEILRALRIQNTIRTRLFWENSLRKELRELGEEEDSFLGSPSFRDALRQDGLSFEEFLERIGTKKIQARRFFKKYDLVSEGKLDRREWQERFLNPFFSSKSPEFLIEDVNDPFLRFAQCCSPLPGDRVMGRLTDEQDLEIHRIQCHTIKKEGHPISTGWSLLREDKPKIRKIHLTAEDKPGVLYKITKVIKNNGAGILHIQSGRVENDASINIRLEPTTVESYHKILLQLRSLKIVKKII
ncbi:MAG: bifunctional (p)ppGpp synthetase/guanosine-3',5'-bis(diphosphate) 3'-pyrophosphohydrolase [SAR324 cluster bacterium]|nr:bifunctional (p)ppGpp synthetase/guanosine-3',5'-bis(diphosphate) 3'-pyrophosphohydrolase [SAR324 cluster bacterium]